MTDNRGFHEPVLLEEAVTALVDNSEGTYVDATFGRGGHSSKILEHLSANGRLIALDCDPEAFEKSIAINDLRFFSYLSKFSEFDKILDRENVSKIDGILFDLGISSPQLSEKKRGFSFLKDGPLDMRFNPTAGQSAADWLAEATEQELADVIRIYGEEKRYRKIAKAITFAKQRKPIVSTGDLAKIVANAIPNTNSRLNPATKTFQALRIYINRELEELRTVLPICVRRLLPGGRIVVISFHSLEDRIVKKFFRSQVAPLLPRHIPIKENPSVGTGLRGMGKPIFPSRAEIIRNPRARSAVMRVAERLAA